MKSLEPENSLQEQKLFKEKLTSDPSTLELKVAAL